MDRPIVLSPPPLELQQYSQLNASYQSQPQYGQQTQQAQAPPVSHSQSSESIQPVQNAQQYHGFSQGSQFGQQQGQFANRFPNSGVGHTERQQSVGYNLQHEFETLTADLDLDLMHRQSVDASTGYAAGAGNLEKSMTPSLLAPSASKYSSFATDLLGSASSGSLLKDHSGSLLKDHTTSPGDQNGLALLLSKKSFLSNAPSRPQSVNDFSNFFRGLEQADKKPQASFFLDMIVFCNWIENLSPQDTITMIEYLCSNLPLDILLAFKSKLDGHLTHHAQPKQVQNTQPLYGDIMSPYNTYSQPDLYQDMDNLNLNKPLPQLHQPKPKLNTYKNNLSNSLYLFVDPKTQRPKSAEPHLNNRYAPGAGPLQGSNQPQQQQQQQQQNPATTQLQSLGLANASPLERSRSPTSHLFEKTSFLQLAAANNSPSIHQQYYSPSASNPSQTNNAAPQQGESMDLTAHTALKLGALATINSRVALDSNRKHPHAGANGNRLTATYEESINRAGNSSSVPLPRNTALGPKAPPGALQLKYKKSSGSPESQKHDILTSLQSSNSSSTSLSSASNSSMPADVSNIELLSNIPAWLKLLRLHKYTECLKDIPWRELVELDNDELENRGVIALGARRKLLKAFQVVKKSVE